MNRAMGADAEVFAACAELAGAGRSFVLITVIRTEGSTPRDAGAKLLWRAEDGDGEGEGGGPGALIGTVGGGQFEHMVVEAAARYASARGRGARGCGVERFVLGADADQCCGGVVEVFFEHHGPERRVVVFGAGHVAYELAPLITGAGLEVVVVDDRAEWNSAERFAGARRVHGWDAGVALAQEKPAATLACVMTCSHDTDFELLRGLLRDPPAFVGLIGSRSKRVCLFGRLVASGVDEGVVQRVRCPIGVGDTGKAPRQVAVSIAAQVLMEARSLGTL